MKIRELRRQLEKSYNNLMELRNKKILSFERTQPSGFHFKELMVSKTPVLTDTFLLHCIEDEELDRPYELAIEEFQNSLEAYNNELNYLAKYEKYLLIEFLKNDQGWKWKDIDKLLHFSEDYSRHYYEDCKAKEKTL